MNLRAIANRATSAINPNVAATVRRANGTVTLAGYRREARYDEIPAIVQIQALTAKDIDHLNGMNITPSDVSCFCNMQLVALDRKTQKGGDLLAFIDPDTGQANLWLVTAILEGWTGSGWCRAALTKQIDQLTQEQIDAILATS